MKIRIIGACGSGKSTAARMLSKHFTIPYFEIDNIVWDRSEESLRFPVEVRDRTFREILAREDWVLEGVQHHWTGESFERADVIFILNPHVFVRDYRIVKRFIRSRSGIEPWNYEQSVSNLWKMITKWNHGYDMDEVLTVTNQFIHKRFIVKNVSEMIQHLEAYEIEGTTYKAIM
ncbi:hypothetical protein [Paenibacillus terrigena]|uniref:hypothetical protein n=1 Tax=Paenibacillus terrigena TaxID=369333 RepID=UPI00037A162B|nr:hypothetical protein [Paenibacillus terrigena]